MEGINLTSSYATPELVLKFAQYQDNTSTEITSVFEYNEDYDLFLQIEKNTADVYHTAYASAENITVSSGFSTDICTVDVYRADATHLQVTLHFA